MSDGHLSDLSVDQLVEEFTKIALAQDAALDADDLDEFNNRLFDEMNVVDDELKSRGPDARRALTRLFTHPNAQVRLKAATKTLAVEPSKARAVLEAIRNSKMPPQYLDAGMTIAALDGGRWRPE